MQILIAILFSMLLPLSSTAIASDVCVCQTASGSGDGSTWDNCAQWSSVTFARENTYYLADGTYGSKTLSTENYAAKYIYIKKATESVHGIATGWSSAYGDGVATFDTAKLTITSDYWDISGITGGGPGSWTYGHGIVFTSATNCDAMYYIDTDGSAHTRLRHIAFIQTGDFTQDATTYGAGGIYDVSVDDLVVEYCYFNNLVSIPLRSWSGSGLVFQYNSNGLVCGGTVYDSDWHCEMIVIHDFEDAHFRWNFIQPLPASVYWLAKNGTTDTANLIRIYGNVFTNLAPIDAVGTLTNSDIINNTFINTGVIVQNGGGWTSGGKANNVIYNCDIASVMSYSWLSGSSTISCHSYADSTSNVTVNFPTTCDSAYETADPFVNSSGTVAEDYTLTVPLSTGMLGVTMWPGLNVCDSLVTCDSINQYNVDMLGNTRGADGVWDRGALEYTGSAPSPHKGRFTAGAFSGSMY